MDSSNLSSANVIILKQNRSLLVACTAPACGRDQLVYEILDLFANCFVITFVCAFGIFGNVINIIVLYRHGFKESTNIALMSLSVSDLLYCIMLLLSKLWCAMWCFDEAAAGTLSTLGTVYWFMPKYVTAGYSFSLIAVIAIERFVAVFFPFHVKKIFNDAVMRRIVVALAVFCILTLSPTFFAYSYEWRHSERYNRTVATVSSTRFYDNNKLFLDVYMWIVLCNVYCTSTVIVVLLCCLAIGFKLTRAAVQREKMTSKATGYDVKVVKMLVTVCALYICVQIPGIIIYIYFNPDFVNMSPDAKVAIAMSNALFAINAAANFLVYVSMSDKFAVTYKNLLNCRGS